MKLKTKRFTEKFTLWIQPEGQLVQIPFFPWVLLQTPSFTRQIEPFFFLGTSCLCYLCASQSVQQVVKWVFPVVEYYVSLPTMTDNCWEYVYPLEWKVAREVSQREQEGCEAYFPSIFLLKWRPSDLTIFLIGQRQSSKGSGSEMLCLEGNTHIAY